MSNDIEFLIILFALSFSAFVKGALGLGFSTICLAILANFIDLKVAISIVLIPSMFSNLIVMQSVKNFRVSVQLFWPMFLMTLIGMSIGLAILTQTNNVISKSLLGLVLIIYGVWSYWNRSFRIKDNMIPKLNPIIGFITGIINGATGSQIFPIMPYLLSLNISKEVFLQTINLSFTLCSIVMMITLWQVDALDINSAIKYSLGVIPVVLGVWLGGKIRKRLSDDRFRQMMMIVIVLLGAALLYRVFS